MLLLIGFGVCFFPFYLGSEIRVDANEGFIIEREMQIDLDE